MFDRYLARHVLGAALLAVLSALCLASANAAVYKWVDEKGVTHYSETPPAKTQSREVRIQSAPATAYGTDDPKPGKTVQQQEAEFQERQKAREGDATKAKETIQSAEKAKSERTTKCADARARIGGLQAQRRSQRAWDERRAIATEKSQRAFDRSGEELNRLGKFVDENCPPE